MEGFVEKQHKKRRGNPDKIGYISALFINKIPQQRSKRKDILYSTKPEVPSISLPGYRNCWTLQSRIFCVLCLIWRVPFGRISPPVTQSKDERQTALFKDPVRTAL
jgi:hypothetical protein